MAAGPRGMRKLLSAEGLLCRELGQTPKGTPHMHSNAITSSGTVVVKEACITA